jgi:hypothetical protein
VLGGERPSVPNFEFHDHHPDDFDDEEDDEDYMDSDPTGVAAFFDSNDFTRSDFLISTEYEGEWAGAGGVNDGRGDNYEQ